jgi:DNA-binding protein YbaB
MALDPEEIMRQAQERMRQTESRLAAMRKQVEQTRVTARSADNMITVVVDGQGELVSLTFSTNKWRKMAPAELGAALVKAIGKARQDSKDELMRRYRDLMPQRPLPPGAAAGQQSLQEMISGMMGSAADHEDRRP